jgi:hypothetical protein
VEVNLFELLFNYGAVGVVLAWFMLKNNKDMETFKTAMQEESKLTREALNDLKMVIAKIGGQA